MSSAARGPVGAGTLAEADGDPTRSRTLRRRYAQRLRGGFGRINTEIRAGVGDRDVFGLGTERPAGVLQEEPDPLPRMPRRRRRDQHIERFDAWLERQQRQGVLEVIDRNGNRFVRAAYGKGLRHAEAALRAEGVAVPDRAIAATFNQPVHVKTLQLLYTSDYSDLEGITAEVSKQANRVLTRGFVEGVGPDELARRLTDVVDDVGKTRATTLARTSVVEAHAEATLNRFEQFGVDEVTVRAEFMTAGDSRVCPICSALEGRQETYTIDEARGGASFTVDGSRFDVRIPIHPRCRCAWLPVVS